jgi:nitric oxide reductase subunit C
MLFLAYTGAVYYYCDPVGDRNKATTEALAGLETWQKYNCQSCHQVYGLGGYLGPDLTNAASAKNPDYLRTFIRYGSGRMPNLHLHDKEVEDIIAFLNWVDKSGRSKVPDSAVEWTGNYKLSQR